MHTETTEATSIISQNVRIEGDIHGNENLQVFGKLKGTLKVKGDIIVGESGVVEAEIEGLNVTIQGTVIGNVLAREHLEIQATGKMIGDISARSIDIKEGSSFEGRSQMIKSPDKKPQPAVEKAADPVEETAGTPSAS
jgi:cytoskeletal protein CcmA (bactofilin family)